MQANRAESRGESRNRRESAVATLFIGAAHELWELESGAVARFLGPVGAVAFGGNGRRS